MENHANGMGNAPMGPILVVQFPNLDCLVYILYIFG